MELPKTDLKMFEGKVKDVFQEIASCKEHMLKYYPFENDNEKRDVAKELGKVREESKQLNFYLKTASKEDAENARAQLRECESLINMLSAIEGLDEKMKELKDFQPEDDFSEELDIFTVEVPKEEPAINAIFEQCLTQFKASINMPSSFEKSLMTINYCLALLCQEQQKDELLGLLSKDARLERLRDELKKILILMEKEKVVDYQLKNILNRTVNQYMSNDPTVLEYEQTLSELVSSLKSIRPFFFSEFFDLIEVCDKNSEKLKQKTIILLLGTTGCGKSTTIQYLSGAQMTKKNDGHIQAFPMPRDLEEFIASSAKRSITRYINPYIMQRKQNNGDIEEIILVDTPGFGDSQGLEVDISNSIGIIRAVGTSKKVYPVIIFNEQNQGGRCELMKEQIIFYSNMIKGMSAEGNNSVNFFFSHYNKRKDIAGLIRETIQDLNAQEQLNLGLVSVLKKMRDLGGQGQLHVLNPLDRMSGQVLNKITSTAPILNPRGNFNLAFKETSKLSLQKQIGLHEQFIIDSLYNYEVEPELISHKIHELQKFAKIIEPYDDTYITRVQQLAEKLVGLVKAKAEAVKKRASSCMEHGNILSDQDIASFQEALNFERNMSPLLEQLNQQDNKEIQSDQGKPSKILEALLSKCSQMLVQLFSQTLISDEKWFIYMEKAGRMAQQIKGCEKILEQAIERYSFKVKEQANIAEEAINQTNIGRYSSASSSFNSIQQEEIKSGEQNSSFQATKPHDQFSAALVNLLIARDKCKDCRYNKPSEEIERLIASAVNKLNDLDKKIKPYFSLFLQDPDSDSCMPINDENINNINLAFSMLKNYLNSCEQISSESCEKLSVILNTYTQMCIEVIKNLKNRIKSLLQNGTADEGQTQEIKNKYAEINLLRKISIIYIETQASFKEVSKLMENRDTKKQIIENLNELCNYAIQNVSQASPNEYKKAIGERLKDLYESLNSLKIVQITYSDPQKFKEKVLLEIIDQFNQCLDKISMEGDAYVTKIEESYQFLVYTANFYDLIQEIYKVTSSYNIVLQKDVGLNWLEYVKKTMQYISQQSNQFNGRLMVLGDYKVLETSKAFLQQFTDGIVPINITNFFKAIKDKLNDPNDPPGSIDARNIISQMNKLLIPQFKILKDSFDEQIQKLKTLTTVRKFEERKIEPEQFEKEIYEVAQKIYKLFKLAHDLKQRYPKSLEKILEEDHPDDDQYIQNYFSVQFRDLYLTELERQRLQDNRVWVYLKLESMRLLKDLDAYIIPKDKKASQAFQNLDEKYFLNQDQEIQKAQEKFQKGEYSNVALVLRNLSEGIVNENAQDIIAKIKVYINFQAFQLFDTLNNKKDIDKQLTSENAKFYSQTSETLLKIHTSLGQFISIKGNSIIQMIENQIIPYLSECFKQQSEDIWNTVQAMNIQEAIDNINQMNQILRDLYQDAGNELRSLDTFKQFYEQASKLVKNDQQHVLDSIKEVCTKIVSRDIPNSLRQPQAKAFYEKISQIKRNQQIQKLCEDFIEDLLGIYYKKCSEIREKLKTQDEDEIENIKIEAKNVEQSFYFMPDEIRITIQPKIVEFMETHSKKVREELETLDNLVLQILRTNIDPLKLSNEYLNKYKSNQISIRINEEIKRYVQSKVKNIVAQINISLNECKIDKVIGEQMPQLISYMKDQKLAEYIFYEFIENQQAIQLKIDKLFGDALSELSQFFKETHKKGEVIPNKFFQHDRVIAMPDQITSIRVLREIINHQGSQSETISECVKDLVDRLKQFFVSSALYLRSMKSQFNSSFKVNGQIQECISVLSNMNFTNRLIYSNSDFIQFLKEIHNTCQKELNDLLTEIDQTNYVKMHEDLIADLTQSQDFILKSSFIDINRSATKDMDEFYLTFYKHYNQIVLAFQTEQRSPINEKQSSKISLIQSQVQQQFEQSMKDVKNSITDLNFKIKQGAYLSTEQLKKFGCYYKSLSSMEKQFKEHRNDAEEIIRITKDTMKERLINIEKEAKTYYETENLNLHKLASILCTIQQMSENMTLFEDDIKETLTRVIEDYREKKKSSNQNAEYDLRQELRGLPGSQGATIALTHPVFKNLNAWDRRKLFQSKSCEDVLKQFKGTDLRDNDKEALRVFYYDFLTVYSIIIDDKMIPRRDLQGQILPIDLSDIKANIKFKYSQEDKRQWVEKDIFDLVSFGNPTKEYYRLVFLLANIFAMWTLMNKGQEPSSFEGNAKDFLLQPHVAQILSIVRILGFGYANLYSNGSKFKKTWKELFQDPSNIRNNLVQIKTGEGKSITLAVVSMIFALNGFEVKCACYSKYLSSRDFESFENMFIELGLQNLIKYGTFNEVSELQINREGYIREIVTALVLQNSLKPSINLENNKRPQVLLIDEVDVFFSESFFGNKYIPTAEIRHEAISTLCDYIWEERQKKVQQLAQMSEEDQKKDKENFPYMSAIKLRQAQVYKDVLNLFKPEYQFLVYEAVKKLVVDVVVYESDDHKYEIHDGLIGYQEQDLISTNTKIGYQTLFAYYKEYKNGQIEEEVFNQQKAIILYCAEFSFAEAPLEYDIILGVTGTLDTLSKPQEEIIKNIYCIEHKTFSPSVHTSEVDSSLIFNPIQGVIVIKEPNDYYRLLVNEMDNKYLNFERPIILFFEDNESLDKFAKSNEFKNKEYQIINEKDNNKEKANKVLKATQRKQITLSTRNFGRGTDFICYDKKVISEGGLVVIQTFLSASLSEETQIRGRTGRQGKSGTYILFLDLQELSKFNIYLQVIEKSANIYKTLCLYRDKKIDGRQNEEKTNREKLKITHDKSTKICNKMKQIIDKNLVLNPEEQKEMNSHLLELNKGENFETEPEVHPMKVLVLIDCTGSMSMTLEKTKNCVGNMIQEVKQELVKNDLSEDLILMKIAGYRNYSSFEKKLFQASPEWTSNTQSLTSFLKKTLTISGGQGNEAIEVGLQFANKEIKDSKGIPLSMIIIIGDAPPNTLEDVRDNRKDAAGSQKDPQYWEKTKDYKQPTHWEQELKLIQEAKVPVHSFYVIDEDISDTEKDLEIQRLEAEFKKLCVSTGECQFLDIHDKLKGQEQLKNLFKYYIVYRVTEINKGTEAAQKAVAHINIKKGHT